MERVPRRSPELGAVLFTLGERASIKSYGYDLCRALDLTAGSLDVSRRPGTHLAAFSSVALRPGSPPSSALRCTHLDDAKRQGTLTTRHSYPILMRGRVETRWEQDPPQGRPVRHLSLIGPPLQLLRGPFSEVSAR